MMNSNPSTPQPDQKSITSPSSSKVCMVCGDKALGYNFNAITCESCKAFFRRNALSTKDFTCPFNEDCKVTVVTRRFCQKCRLQKCFVVGMKKEYIMSEEDKVMKRKKIEQNRAKKRMSVSSGNSNDAVVPIKIKKEEGSLDGDSWREGSTSQTFIGKSPDTFQNSVSSYGSPASTFDEHNQSPVQQTPKFGLFSDFVPRYPANQTATNQPINSSSPTSTTNGFPQPVPNPVVELIHPTVTMESSASEMVSAILNSQIGPKAVLDSLMKTPNDAVYVMSKIINSPNDAMELIAHLIASPGDALHIISKIMNSPLDALTVFVQFMSSPTDAIQIIGKIMNSPSDVLQFMQQLMNSPEDATQIMNKYMNSPLEAIKKINQMINHQESPVDSTTNGITQQTTDSTTNSSHDEESKNAIVRSMLDAFQDGQHNFFTPSSGSVLPQPKLEPNSSLSCETTSAANYNSNHMTAGGQLTSLDNERIQRTEDIIISVMDDVNSVFEQSVSDGLTTDGLSQSQSQSLPKTFDSVLCEAIRLEYESFNVEEQSSCSGRDLNSVEDVKLKELVMANEALYDPVDDEYDLMSNPNTPNPELLRVINLTAVAVRRLIKMAKKITAFKNMCQEDQLALLKGGCIEMMMLRAVMQFDEDQNTWKVPHRGAMANIKADVLKLAKGDIYEKHKKFLTNFEKKWRSDIHIIPIMCAIVLFTPDRYKVVHSDVIKLEQTSYYCLLRRYLESVYPGCEAKSSFLRLIKKIQELQKLNEEVINVYLNVNPTQIEPLLLEIFDLKGKTQSS